MSNSENDRQLPPPVEPLEAALDDVSAELGRVEALASTPVSSVVELDQNLPELSYYEAELSSLRSALREERDRPRPAIEAEHP
jgi:hypothetical protein